MAVIISQCSNISTRLVALAHFEELVLALDQMLAYGLIQVSTSALTKTLLVFHLKPMAGARPKTAFLLLSH